MIESDFGYNTQYNRKCLELKMLKKGKEMSFNLEYSKIDNITFDDIDYDDYPKFIDAFIDSADYDGEPINEGEIDMLNDNSEFVHEKLMEHLY